MRGDLGGMNVADKEIIALEDTLYKLNLLIDTSKSATAKKVVLAEVMTDGSVAVLGEYDISPYATDPLHEEKVMNILSKIGVMDSAEKIDDYIKGKYLSSPVTGEMIISAAEAYEVDARLMMAIMEQDSRFGTVGIATSTLNPGNVGNDDSGNTRTYESWQEGVTAVAEWLNRHRVSGEVPEEIVVEPMTTAPATASSSEETLPVITSTTTTTTTASSSFSPTPTPTPATTPIVTASPSPTASPSYSPTPTPTPEVTTSTTTTTTSTPTPQPSDEPSAGTAEPSPSPTPELSPTPTPESSASPTPEPEASPSPDEETPAN